MARASTEGEMARDERNFKAQLDEMPKESIFIPEDPLNPDDVVPIGINGVIYAVPRGQEFQVPKPIAEIWRESNRLTIAANRKIAITEKRDVVVTG